MNNIPDDLDRLDQKRRKEEQKSIEQIKYVEESGYLVPSEQAAADLSPQMQQQPSLSQNQQPQQQQPQPKVSGNGVVALSGNEAVFQDSSSVNVSSGEGFTQPNTEEHELETRLKYVYFL